MKRILLLLALAASTATAQNERLTIREAMDLAERSYETVTLNRVTLDQATLSERTAEAARLPKLDATASYTRISKTGAIELSFPGLPLPSRSIAFGDGNVWETALTASVPLFTGFRLDAAIEAQRQQRNIAEYTLAGSITEVRNQAARLYRSAQLAGKTVGIIEAQQRLIDENLAARKRLLTEGQALAIDTLQLATRLLQLEVDRTTALLQKHKAVLMLMELTGRTEPFSISEDAPEATALLDRSADELLRIATETRADFKTLTATRRLAESSITASKATLYPSIYGQASYRYSRPGVDQIRNQWMDYYTAGVKLEWNLFSWGADARTIEKQELEITRNDLRGTQLTARVRSAIGTLVDDIALRRQTAGLLTAQIAMERQKQQIVQARYHEGLATSSDLIDAESSLTTALIRLEQTRIDLAMTATDLANTIGLSE